MKLGLFDLCAKSDHKNSLPLTSPHEYTRKTSSITNTEKFIINEDDDIIVIFFLCIYLMRDVLILFTTYVFMIYLLNTS